MKKYSISILVLASILLSACSPSASPTGQLPEIRVLTHDAFSVSESVIAQFETDQNARIVFIKSGDAGSLVNRAILTKSSPEADVLYGIDNTYLSRALDEGIFDTYDSPVLSEIPPDLILDPTDHVVPIDYGDVCINYDRQYFSARNLEVPGTLDMLTEPQYRNLLVVENPAVSSPGLAFLMTTIAVYGEDGYLAYWQRLKDNGVVIVNDWTIAYNTNFSGSAGKGLQPLVVSYDTSPAAEVYYAETPPTQPPTGAITTKGMCFRQIEFAGILKGGQNPELAAAFIDFMLGLSFQEDIPLQMFMFPANPSAKVPDVFRQTVTIPTNPVSLDPALIAKNRDQWIQAWTSLMLH